MAVLTAGCTIATTGPRLSDFPSATGPEGATVRVTVSGTAYLGQLLETRPDAILILSSTRFETKSGSTVQVQETVVRLLPYARVDWVQFQRGSKLVAGKWVLGPGSRERFRLLSRFPQGLTPELLQQLLKMYGQTAPAGGKP
jgi:hypothetical protein